MKRIFTIPFYLMLLQNIKKKTITGIPNTRFQNSKEPPYSVNFHMHKPLG